MSPRISHLIVVNFDRSRARCDYGFSARLMLIKIAQPAVSNSDMPRARGLIYRGPHGSVHPAPETAKHHGFRFTHCKCGLPKSIKLKPRAFGAFAFGRDLWGHVWGGRPEAV